MRNVSLADSELTLSGVLHAQPEAQTHVPLESALQISLDVVRLVAAAHDEGRVVGVLDAAHLICRQDGALAIGGVGGNPLAPELQRGDPPDRLTDVYALGALMYRLLTGRKVDRLKVIEPPSHFNPAVDSDLDELVLSALDEDPSERPYSARALERRMIDIFDELGLVPGVGKEALRLLPKVKAAKGVLDDGPLEGQDDVEVDPRDRTRLQQWLYDVGWSAAPQRRPVDTEAIVRNRFEQWMYDCGWFQNVDWRAPEIKKRLKVGGIALGVLLLLFVCWPSHKRAKPSASELAVASMQKSAAPPPAVIAKPQVRPVASAPAPVVKKKPSRTARR